MMVEADTRAAAGADLLQFEGLILDLSGRTLTAADGSEIALTRAEFELLSVLIRSRGRALSRDQCLDAVAGRRAEPFDRTIDVLISRLRRKIEPERNVPRLLLTVPGHGYKFASKLVQVMANRDEPASPLLAVEKPSAALAAAAAERRLVTVMVCSLFMGTVLPAQLDPEERHGISRAFRTCCGRVCGHHGGVPGPVAGDTVHIYFGLPVAHEHDAERAVRAGLDLAQAVRRLDVGSPLHTRIGIATGLVVVGDVAGQGSDQERAAVGETPNLATRLHVLAEPGGVVIDSATRRLTGGLFEYADLEPASLWGFAAPASVVRVVRETATANRFEALRAVSTPFIGRGEELALLERRWHQAKTGEGSVVLISGEPGIGKSRLVQTLLEHIAGEPHARLHCFCSPHHQDSALYPYIAQLERAAEFRRDDTAGQRLDKLELLLAQATDKPDEAAPLIAELLSIQSGERYPPLELSPQKRKQKTLRTLLGRLEGQATRQPVLMLFEDAHWSDPTSIELLDLIVDRAASLQLLLIITFRPEVAAPWIGRPHVSLLSLNRLPPRERRAILAGVTRGKSLPCEIVEQIIDRTDGVPLFVEELTKAVIESGTLTDLGDHYALTGPVPSLAIPATLHGSLLARLDRLGSVREIAQIGAALGRQFSHDLISIVAAMPQPQLDDALTRLVGTELVYRRGAPPDAEYTFKHALVQDAAYQSMLRSRRADLHARIADALERSFPELVETEPETLARHFATAALAQRAIPYWLAAGRRAYERGTLKEAIVQLNAGIGLLAEVQDETLRMELELDLQNALGLAFSAVKSYAAPEVEAAYSRARELGLRTGKRGELARAVRGLAWVHTTRGNPSVGKALFAQLLKQTDTDTDDELSMVTHSYMGMLLEQLGERSEAEVHFAIAEPLYNPQRQLSAAFESGISIPRAYHAWNLAYLGHVDTALAVAEDAVSLARLTGNSLVITQTLVNAAECLVELRDPAGAASFAEEAAERARDHGFPPHGRRAQSIRGWASALQAGARAGVREIREAIASTRCMGEERHVTLMLHKLSEAELATGDPNAAAEAASEALRLGERIAPYWIYGPLYTHGDAMVALGDLARAEADYHRALAWSSERNEKWIELNAALRLARLWQTDGRAEDAHDLLAPVYSWFTEGFDNPVLRDAKKMLDELTGTFDSAVIS